MEFVMIEKPDHNNKGKINKSIAHIDMNDVHPIGAATPGCTQVPDLAQSSTVKSFDYKSRKRVKITHQMIEDCYKQLRRLVEGEKINAATITAIVGCAMQLADDQLHAGKQYKIELSLAILRKLIDEEVGDDAENIALHMLVETTVPVLMAMPSKSSGVFARLCACCI